MTGAASLRMDETSVFTIAGTDYALGLEWVAASRNPVTLANLPRQALKIGATHIAWRARSHQVGFARIDLGKKPARFRGWRAAAAAFADLPQPAAEPHAQIAAFAFQSGEIWVVAASYGRLFSDGDRLFTDLAAAKAHFHQLYERVPRWGMIFAPDDWGYQRAVGAGPLSFLSRSAGLSPGDRSGQHHWHRLGVMTGLIAQPGVALQQVKGGVASNNWITAAVIVACLMLVGGGWQWRTARHRSAPVPPQQVVAPFFPLRAASMNRLNECIRAIDRAEWSAATPGWDITEISCDKEAITVSLAARANTPLTSLITYHPDAQLQSTSRTARFTTSLKSGADPVALGPDLPAPETILALFGRLDERVHGVNSFTPPVPPNDPGPIEMGVARPRPYRLMSWSLQTSAPPTLWRRDLSALPTVEIGSLALKRGDGGLVWTIRGIAYVAQ